MKPRYRSEFIALVAAVCLAPATASAAVSAKGASYTLTADSTTNVIRLVYTSDETGSKQLVVSELPAHGTLSIYGYRADGTYGLQEASKGDETFLQNWVYVPAPGYTGKDRFSWQLRVEGGSTSTVAVINLNIVANSAPEAADQGVIVVRDAERQLPLLVSDADEDRQPIAIEIDKQPAHGSLSVNKVGSFGVARVMYKPSPGFVGEDSFVWHASDGTARSSSATCRLLVRAPDNHAKTRVLVVVEARLGPELDSELQRLLADLRAEGYESKLIAFGGKSAAELWSLLRGEYTAPGAFVAGAVLVGRMPLASSTISATIAAQTTDLYYWNLRRAGRTEMGAPQLWVSRIHGAPTERELETIRWALQANHDTRTDRHRLPHTAFHYSVSQFDSDYRQSSESAGALEVWPIEQVLETHKSWALGGDLIKSLMHGSQLSGQYTTHNGHPIQTRYNCLTSCSRGSLGGISNQMILSRGGGGVFSVGATTTTYVGAFDMLGAGTRKLLFRQRLAAGDAWGAALRDSYPFGDYQRAIFYGDMSMRVAIAKSNQAPTVDSLNPSATSGRVPLTITLNATASDADDAVERYEWFCKGLGDAVAQAPAAVGPSARCGYQLPHRYPLDLQVVDRFKARGWKEQLIVAQPNPSEVLRINAGRVSQWQRVYVPGADFVDRSGFVWLHEERHVADGGWGFSSDNTLERLITATSAIANTDNPEVFRSYRMIRGTGHATYRLPLGNGRFTVWLALVEPDSKAVAGERLLEAKVEGAVWLAGYDVFKETGSALRAVLVAKSFEVTDGELTIELRKAAGSAKDAVFSALVIAPGDAVGAALPDAGQHAPDAGVGAADQRTAPTSAPDLGVEEDSGRLLVPDAGVPAADRGTVTPAGRQDAAAAANDSAPSPDLGSPLPPDPIADTAPALDYGTAVPPSPSADAGVGSGSRAEDPAAAAPGPGGASGAVNGSRWLDGGCALGQVGGQDSLFALLLLLGCLLRRRRGRVRRDA